MLKFATVLCVATIYVCYKQIHALNSEEKYITRYIKQGWPSTWIIELFGTLCCGKLPENNIFYYALEA